ncbi:MAG: hypothetical protein MK165_03450 [Pirellulaceae bacterium]|nr:hypothetical protein [Pirellulaceae bacterium]
MPANLLRTGFSSSQWDYRRCDERLCNLAPSLRSKPNVHAVPAMPKKTASTVATAKAKENSHFAGYKTAITAK